jgi:hypothetical protein
MQAPWALIFSVRVSSIKSTPVESDARRNTGIWSRIREALREWAGSTVGPLNEWFTLRFEFIVLPL